MPNSTPSMAHRAALLDLMGIALERVDSCVQASVAAQEHGIGNPDSMLLDAATWAKHAETLLNLVHAFYPPPQDPNPQHHHDPTTH